MQTYYPVRLYPKNKENCFDVCLELPSGKRKLGELNLSGEGTFTSFPRNEKDHLHRILNSLGLNYHLLTSKKVSYKWIVIPFLTSEGIKKNLVTSRDYFLRYGKIYQFGKQGFELQYFLELDHFSIEKARLFEAKKVIQQNLFDEVEHGIREHSNTLRELPDIFNKHRADFGSIGAS